MARTKGIQESGHAAGPFTRLTFAVERVQEQLAREPDRGAALERERAALARKVERLVAAIGDGRGPVALVQEIARAEARLQEIEAEMARLAAASRMSALDLKRLEREVEAELARFADVLRGAVPRVRQALKKLLVDRAEFTPVPTEKKKRTYAFKAELSYGAILQGVPVEPFHVSRKSPWGHHSDCGDVVGCGFEEWRRRSRLLENPQ